ncbi:hydrogenase expression/formation protein HypE [Rodentibacter trehalosifermentans]|uniref:Hydrogenase expression/formation protein HypE n=1 Tax=Rodentibacter trehalosifermentans TaxID=1908263 RepID=A0A1V3ISQ7_9PAST|nr:hydrogenase expression/formation protein HypE [Rodentibacter trehalosifermentans]OOF45287.1 hydrogenase expression/formation protein HypE [Rodentibacter trehalosifermentans]OOF47475.1 hydrogenase expression/formation protein HypE [Rodentibacter trehalosifermentans]OOF53150.1 hydrogenase expression/formation protein HypE [Rodentibacter trehalosifermentans]
MSEFITMAHGNGGAAMQQLIQDYFVEAFDNPILSQGEDQARIPLAELTQQGEHLSFSTDSFVIDPIFFPGGDIGKLAVCGTANDVAVCGAMPKYLSCGFILEEGLPLSELKQIIQSMAETARLGGIQVVTGDTKVVAKGAVDKIFINTSGLGVIPKAIDWGVHRIQPGDKIIVSGTIGDHGATIINLREKLGIQTSLQSDCAVLYPLIERLREVDGVKAVRDATRGGVNAVLHEFAQAQGLGVTVDEQALPIRQEVRGICELLGLEALNFANEGKLVIVATAEKTPEILTALRPHPLGENAAVIGEMTTDRKVRIRGVFGQSRLLDLPTNEPLPRIC